MPGMLPVINRYCVRAGDPYRFSPEGENQLQLAVRPENYFYPDLPAGYQISQYKNPIVGEGEVLSRFATRADGEKSALKGCISSRMPERVSTISGPTIPTLTSTAPGSL